MAEILVCDDDKDIVEAIEIYLTQEGHHILKAYDGEQAIRVLTEQSGRSSDHRCNDAEAGWYSGDIEDSRKKCASDHYFIGKIRGCRQDPRVKCRSR